MVGVFWLLFRVFFLIRLELDSGLVFRVLNVFGRIVFFVVWIRVFVFFSDFDFTCDFGLISVGFEVYTFFFLRVEIGFGRGLIVNIEGKR